MLALLIGLGLAVICLAFVALPFLRKRLPPRDSLHPDGTSDGETWALQEIRMLESERDLGDLTEEELGERREEARLRAARTLREWARDRQGQPQHDQVAKGGTPAAHPQASCPHCGVPLLSRMERCPVCGASLPAQPRAPGAAPDA